jgi:hypothetical protein
MSFMSYPATVFNVTIASPSDVTEERRIAREAIYNWNAINSESDRLILRPLGWESDTTPEMGEQPQGIINRQMLSRSDLLVAIFWTRVGTPTGKFVSGTVEEIEEHQRAGKMSCCIFQMPLYRRTK